MLPELLGVALALGVVFYVIMDGFDLGLGILFLFAPSDADRDRMMQSIAPIWDANETWLVYGGTLLLAAFPVAYAGLLPALYVPLMVMLFALIFRGIAFEFRFHATRFRHLWDWSFSGGSTIAALCQGLCLGAFVTGVPVHFGLFALACGLGLIAGYALLGATWLIFKSDQQTAAFGRRVAPAALLLSLLFIAFVSLWTPLAQPHIAARWFAWPNFAFLWPIPAGVAVIAFALYRALRGTQDTLPFLLSIALFLAAFLGLGVSLWPYAIPYQATLAQAAASPPTLKFVAVGVACALPVTIAYLGYSHWVFRGKR